MITFSRLVLIRGDAVSRSRRFIDMFEAIDPAKVVTEIKKKHTPTLEEDEGPDIRLEFEKYTMWVRDDGSLDGSLPKSMKADMDAIVRKFKLDSNLEYR